MEIDIGPSRFQEPESADDLREQKEQENQGSKSVAELTRSSIFSRSSESFGAKFWKAITPTIKRMVTRPFFFRFLGSELFLNLLIIQSMHNP